MAAKLKHGPGGPEPKGKGIGMKSRKKGVKDAKSDVSKDVRNDGATKLQTRERIYVAAHQLRPAPWNPRPEITSESVADITASIREIGLIQPIVAVPDPDKRPYGGVSYYMVIAGHRRLKAAIDAGLAPIPVDVVDCSLDVAKRITMIENLQRRDVDPLMEADLIAGLIEGGMTRAEIAAETGRGEQWVARRANLVKLSQSWRKCVSDGKRITVDCLEHVAAYPERIQEKLAKAGACNWCADSEALAWYNVKYEFARESRELGNAMFDARAKCLACPNNTGCCRDLFDDVTSELGCCLDAKCYAKCEQEVIDAEIEKAAARGYKVYKGAPWTYRVYGSGAKKPTKGKTALYVYSEAGHKVMVWHEPPPEPEPEKADPEELKRRKAEAKRVKLVDAAREEAADSLVRWIDEQPEDGVWPKWVVDCAIKELHRALDEVGSGCEEVIDAFMRNVGCSLADKEAEAVYKEFLAAGK